VLAYFDRPGTSNGPTEAINGRLEQLRGSALAARSVSVHRSHVEMRVVLKPDVDADAEDIERLGRQLRDELRSLDVDSVDAVSCAEPPPGSKGPVVEAMTEWLVILSASGGVFTTLIATINDWLGRRTGPQRHEVKVVINDDTLELNSATSEEQAELIKAFVQRHRPG
jgi:hypothetical protein